MKSTYDLIVVGGGITGAGIAWDAALRGIDTLLLEKGDFGAETSAGCFKIAHGGLRYLKSLNLKRLKESAREQLFLRRNAPGFLRPFELFIPTAGAALKSKFAVSSAIKTYGMLVGDVNSGFLEEDKLQPLRFYDEGVSYGECYFTNSERFTFLVAKSAEAAGTDIYNYTGVADATSTSAGWEVSLEGGAKVTSRFLVNATGQSWEKLEKKPTGLYSKGLQAVIPKELLDKGIAIEHGSRSYFAYPWNGLTLVGTTDAVEAPLAGQLKVNAKEIEQLLEAALGGKAALSDVSWVFGGYRLLKSGVKKLDDDAHKVAGEELIHPFSGSEKGLSVVSVKYTTFRSVAERVVDRIADYLGVSESSRTLETKLWSAPEDLAVLRTSCSDSRLIEQYGSLALDMQKSGELEVLSEDETAKTLEDILFRRSILGFSLSEKTLSDAVDIVAEKRGWSDSQKSSEVSSIQKLFKARMPWR